MVNANGIRELVHDRLKPLFDKDQQKLKRIDRWYRENPEPVRLPRDATPEHKYLAELARTPVLNLVITTLAQTLYLERVYSSERSTDDVAQIWLPWQRNRMASKQVPLHSAALAYGSAYAQVLPGEVGGEPAATITCHSPLTSIAVYGDVVEDEFPMFFMRLIPQKDGYIARVTDEESVHSLVIDASSDAVEYIEPRHHNLGYVPVIRYANQMDLEGRTPGEIEPFIPIAARLNKTDYDRLLVQHYNSWKVRTATGLEKPGTEQERREQKMLLRQTDILTGGDGVTFGTLDETNLKPFIEAHDSDIETLAAMSQTPMTAFGKLVNVSAEGLAETRASLYAKRDQRQASFGQSHVQLLRVASDIEGRRDDALDFTLEPQWADTEIRTLNGAADALGKMAEMLGIPQEVLWDRIPGVSLTTAESWKKYAEEHPSPAEREARASEIQANALAAQL